MKKMTVEQDIKLMITATNEGNKEDIGHAINSAKSAALKDINDKYNALLKNLTKYNTTKEDLENETKIAVDAMNTAKLTGVEIQKTMTSVIEQHKQVAQDIIISRASITQAHQRKVELDQLITTTTNDVLNLANDITSFKNIIKTVTATSKDKAFGDATTYCLSHNNVLLHQMEQVFACNMQLMEDEKDDFKVMAAVQTKIKNMITPETMKKILDTVSNIDKIKSGLQNIIVALVRRQPEMEDTFKTKMDRDFKEKSDISNLQ